MVLPPSCSPNVNPHCPHHSFAFLYFCECPDFCPELLYDRVELGMKLQCPLSNLISTADGIVQTFNSLNQNPCTVAAYLESVCNNGGGCACTCIAVSSISSLAAATIDPLPPGWVYRGPSDRNLYGADLCLCNTVTYSLLSACGACQGNSWITCAEISCLCRSSFMYLLLGGPNMYPTAQRLCRLRREFPAAAKKLKHWH